MERSRARQREEESRRPEEEEESESFVVGIEKLSIETAGTEEESIERLEAVLRMENEEDGGVEGEGEEGGDGTQRSPRALELLTQDAGPSRTMIFDYHNGFNKLSRSAMLWTVQHRWPERARLSFNLYRH